MARTQLAGPSGRRRLPERGRHGNSLSNAAGMGVSLEGRFSAGGTVTSPKLVPRFPHRPTPCTTPAASSPVQQSGKRCSFEKSIVRKARLTRHSDGVARLCDRPPVWSRVSQPLGVRESGAVTAPTGRDRLRVKRDGVSTPGLRGARAQKTVPVGVASFDARVLVSLSDHT